MSITQGLFSDVLANAPGGGTADWSKTLPMAGAVDWTKVTPFQVINPLTGYNYGSTQGTAAKPAEAEAPQMSEYQKWLAKQSQTYTSSDRGGGFEGQARETPWGDILGDTSLNGKTWAELTPTQQAMASSIVDPMGIGKPIASFVLGNPLAQAGLQFSNFMDKQLGRQTPAEIEAQQKYGLSLDNYRDIVNQMSVNGQGGFMAGPAPNQGMSLADQYAAYNSGRVAYNEGGGGTTAANDSYSGSPGGESSGGSYAGGDVGYSGEGRGDYF